MQVCGAAIGWLLGDISLSIGLALCMGGMVWLDPAASRTAACPAAVLMRPCVRVQGSGLGFLVLD
jgi:hypothetical protein